MKYSVGSNHFTQSYAPVDQPSAISVLHRQLLKRLPHYTFVDRPDHPLLYEGPDILVAAPEKLAAIFVCKTAEGEQPRRLLSRLVAARLALPEHTRCILVVPEEQRQIGERLSYHFHATLDVSDPASLAYFLEDAKAQGPAEDIPEPIRRFVYRRYQIAWNESRIKNFVRSDDEPGEIIAEPSQRSRRDANAQRSETSIDGPRSLQATAEQFRKVGFEDVWVRSWTSPQTVSPVGSTQRRTPMVRRDETVVGVLPNRPESPMESVKPFCRNALTLNFSLQSGVPYLTQPTVNILISEEIPLGRFDPEKPMRSAAFCGWTIYKTEDPDSVQEYSDYLSRKLPKI